ncbi:MAG TPA: oxygen-independent coproporphyrinogen III oxidase [Gemmatimonadales bacterium]|nr:oxygen-independent coproporphyrinogen III oxidase [Gemmatimonadales bacterium]
MFTDPAEAFRGITPELLNRLGRPVPRYTSYPPVPAWGRDFGAAAYREALERAAAEPGVPLSVYVHLPFCALRCLYCGCNVRITSRKDRIDAYLDRLEREMDLVTEVLGRGRRVSQIHLGGGTPNYLADAQLERLGGMLRERFRMDSWADASIEVDPRHASAGQFAVLRKLGFCRMSLGVQDLDPEVQQAIGRIQPLELVRRVAYEARAAGFGSVNLDLIYGLPRQTEAGFAATIESVLTLAPDRIACFGYAHVPTVQPHQRALERYGLPEAQRRFALNRVAIEMLVGGGYRWIGFDHFARPDDALAIAAASGRLHRNFNGYTVMPAKHLLAFGMSAISEVGGCLAQGDGNLSGWEAAIDAGRLPVVRGHRLTADDLARRAAILDLMCRLELPASVGEGALAGSFERLLAFAEDGLVEGGDARVRVTPRGRLFLRTLCSVFDAYLPDAPAERPMARAI